MLLFLRMRKRYSLDGLLESKDIFLFSTLKEGRKVEIVSFEFSNIIGGIEFFRKINQAMDEWIKKQAFF
jgi:hypothetical protein